MKICCFIHEQKKFFCLLSVTIQNKDKTVAGIHAIKPETKPYTVLNGGNKLKVFKISSHLRCQIVPKRICTPFKCTAISQKDT